MKRIVLALSFLSIGFISFGQIENPVSWNYEAKKKTADTYEIVITADIEHPWHIYSQNTGKGGPIPTSVTFKANPLITKNGAVKEVGKLEKIYDKNFETNVLSYSDKVQWVQTVKVKGGIKTNISGTIEYMVCDDSHCLPPTKKSFDLKLQ
ncbi:MAG: protein-disulfide reductase DsbD domain-containing protein [Bacteroidota bacterium]